ncbi:MAG: haloacid dehalogenase type II [Betaproteobacteria bacterium]|jgi:2-haloacid dehalogenase
MYKVVVFDAYGTLFDVYSMSELADTLFPGHGAALSTMWRDKQIEYTRLVSMADPIASEGTKHYLPFWEITILALRYTCERLKLELSEYQEMALMEQYAKLRVFDDCLGTLSGLKDRGISLSILSNGSQEMLNKVVKNNHMSHLFDKLISVDEVCQFKILPVTYQLVLDEYKCLKNEVLFVSCNAWDVVGAAWFGFDTYWVNRQSWPYEKIGFKPTIEAANLLQLTHIVK